MKKLPSLSIPTYRGTLQSSGKNFEFHPFRVGEQKVLLMALESGSAEQIYLAFKNLINVCVISPHHTLIPKSKQGKTGEGSSDDLQGRLDLLPSFDVESIFLQIVAKSVGEISRVSIDCEQCQHSNVVEHNLTKVELKNKEKAQSVMTGSNTIVLDEDQGIGIKMRFPSLNELFETEEHDGNISDSLILRTIKSSIECIFDENEVYPLEDVSDEELNEFLDSLSMDQMRKVESFFDDMPYLALNSEFKCEKCGHLNQREIRGLKNFFS